MISRDTSFVQSGILADINGRNIIVTDLLYNIKVALVNIHGRNIDDSNFFQRISKVLSDLNSHTLVMGGDFNLC